MWDAVQDHTVLEIAIYISSHKKQGHSEVRLQESYNLHGWDTPQNDTDPTYNAAA